MRYNLDELGWLSFENLCQTLLKLRLGFGIESWSGSGDWGRDAYFEGNLTYPSNQSSSGPFVFQCKFVSNANAVGSRPFTPLKSSVRSEATRILEHLSSKKWDKEPRHYSLMTNVQLGPKKRLELKRIIHDALPSSEVHFHTGEDICCWIDADRNVLKSFPQLFTIRDVSELLATTVNKHTLERSAVAIDYAIQKAEVFVETSAYVKAQKILQEEHFVVLEGPPEMGKTTIGRVIALAQIQQEWTAYECRSPDEILANYDRDTMQVFVADDFFGRTEYEPQRVSLWQSELSHILPKLDDKHWLILTCRAHLLEMGKSRLDVAEYSEHFPTIGEVLVNAGELNEIEKAKILYRHAKKADLDQAAKKAIADNAECIVHNAHYTPERIRRLVTAEMSTIRELDEMEVQRKFRASLSEPTKQMEKSFVALDDGFRWALFSLLPVSQKHSAVECYKIICPIEHQVSEESAFRPLTESFIQYREADFIHDEGYQWIHPSCRDLAIKLLSDRASDRQHFLKHCPSRGLTLACSVGGGTGGSVNLPLLQTDDDWSIFTERVAVLVSLDAAEGIVYWDSFQSLILKDHAHEKIQRFEIALEHIANASSFSSNTLSYLNLRPLESLTSFAQHFDKAMCIDNQIKGALERISELSVEHLTMPIDSIAGEIEALVNFALYLESSFARHPLMNELILRAGEFLSTSATVENLGTYLTDDIESETDADQNEEHRNTIARSLESFCGLREINADTALSIASNFDDFYGLSIYCISEDSPSSSYVEHESSNNEISIGSIFSDL